MDKKELVLLSIDQLKNLNLPYMEHQRLWNRPTMRFSGVQTYDCFGHFANCNWRRAGLRRGRILAAHTAE
jgi:hypothetical protein